MLRNDSMKMQVAKNWEIKREFQKIIPKLWKNDEPSPKNLYTAICNAKMNYIHQLDDEEYFSDLFGEYHGGKVSQARRIFDFSMTEQRKITFPDMLYLAECNLNDDPSFRRKWQSQFEYVIVDEGQDTNAQAMRILTMLAKPQDQFVIVGDHDQMMYRFTGATPEANLLDGFSDRYSDSNLYMMDTNYRSRASIVKIADRLIQYNYANRGGSIAEIFRKAINPFSKDEGNDVHFEMYDDVYEEAKSIAEDIKIKLDSEKVIPGEIFIGARTRAQLGNLEPILTEMKIPFVNITGNSFWNFKHMKIAVAYLRLVDDPSDSDAFSTIYNVASSSMTVPWRSSENYGRQSATRFLGKEFVKWCGGNYRKLFLINNDYEIPSRWRDGATDLMEFMDGLEYEIECEGVAAGVQYIIDYCLTDWLRLEDDFSQDGDIRKIDDLYTLHDLAIKHKDLPPLLTWVQKCLDAAESARSGNLDEYIVLSTYHRLKGLERNYVYGMGWCEGQNAKTGKPMGLLPHTYALTTPPTNDPLDIPNQNSVSDERSIGFVAITRAKKAVYLSGVRHYRNAVMCPSRFIEEMGLT
jgi:DNA helicase-2/ATP-dependent DNA helicase PcrA